MNFLSGTVGEDGIQVAGRVLTQPPGVRLERGDLKVGIRPEYVTLVPPEAAGSVPATVTQLQDVGTHYMLTASAEGQMIKVRLPSDADRMATGSTVWLQVLSEHACFYKDESLVS
jgi:glycerol transport system ATP-binding protein